MATSIHVIDLGLDFKTYAKFTDTNGNALLSNLFHFRVEDLSVQFLPTCGLLTAVVHGYAASAHTPLAAQWLAQYRVLQTKLFEEGKSPDAGHSLAFLSQTPFPTAHQLLSLLDRQVNMSGVNAPSKRPVTADSKHAFCNLFDGNGCHQGVQCNQLHLAGPMQKHRHEFFLQVVDVLRTNGFSVDQIRTRLIDSLFFARYGNKVTVEGRDGQHFQFFKTMYTDGRVKNALRIEIAPVSVFGGAQSHRPQRVAQDPVGLMSQLSIEANELIGERGSPTTRAWNTMVAGFVRQSPQVNAPIDPRLAQELRLANLEFPPSFNHPHASSTSTTATTAAATTTTDPFRQQQAPLLRLGRHSQPAGDSSADDVSITPLIDEGRGSFASSAVPTIPSSKSSSRPTPTVCPAKPHQSPPAQQHYPQQQQ